MMDVNNTDSLMATVNGAEIPYFTQGTGETILFLHGALADMRIWQPHCALLSDNFRTMAYTQRYFGPEAVSFAAYPFGIETHCNDLKGFIEALGIGPVHLVAWSYGADIALNLAVQAPHLLQSLFLYEPGFPGYLDSEPIAHFMADANQMFVPIFDAVAEGNIEQGVKLLIDGSGNQSGYFDRQCDAFKTQQMQNAHTLPLQLSQAKPPVLTQADLAGIELPTQVAYGEDTRPLFQVVAEAAQASIKECTALIVPNANHMYPLENPTQFARNVAEFIAGLQGSRTD